MPKLSRVILIAVLLIAGFTGSAQHFTQGGVIDVGSIKSTAAGDYDKDGDDDVLMASSRDAFNHMLSLWKLTNGVFEQQPVIELGLPARGSDVQWIDFDKDNDLDAFISLQSEGGTNGYFYSNNNGHFTKVPNNIPANLPAATYQWGDFEGDGDLDALVTTGIYARLFTNDNSTFKEVLFNNTYQAYGLARWVDFDSDGDLDVYVGSYDYNGGVIFENTPNGLLIAVRDFPPNPLSAEWADFDDDGDPDLLIKSNGILRVYQNQGTRNFTMLATLNITPTSQGLTRWIDFDKDGDLDIFNSGSELGIAELFVRNNGIYTKKTDAGLPSGFNVNGTFVDYDKDNDLDMILGLESTQRIYQNDAGANPVPLVDTPGPAADLFTMPNTLTSINLTFFDYSPNDTDWIIEIRRGDAATFEVLTTIASTQDFLISHVATGLVAGVRYAFRVRSHNTSGYSRYTDNVYSYVASPDFPKTDITSTFDYMALPNLVDIDNDNDLDLALSGHKGDPMNPSKVYLLRNNAGTFSTVGSNIPELFVKDMDWADFDSDGDQDLLLSGFVPISNNGYTYVLKNIGGFQFEEVLSIPGGAMVRWVDLNADGRVDFLSMNSAYLNDSGSFSPAQGYEDLPALDYGEMASADFNGDGLTDFVHAGRIPGFNGPGSYLGLVSLKQTNGRFKITQRLDAAAYTGIKSGDFDADGDADLIAAAFDMPVTIFWNDGTGVFTKGADNGLPVVFDPNMQVGDLDNDGDLDLVCGGYYAGYGNVAFNKVFKNDGHGVFTESNIAMFPGTEVDYALGDFDNDRDLDIVEVGFTYDNNLNQTVKAFVMKNITAGTNGRPAAPTITNIVQKAGGLEVEWTAGADNSIAPTANMYVLDPNGKYRFNNTTDLASGQLRRPSKGNVTSGKATIKELFVGDMEIGLQSIDNSFIGSTFTTALFEVLPLAPERVTIDTTACEGSTKTLEVAGQYVQWYKSAAKGDKIATGNKATFNIKKKDTTFYATQLFLTNEIIGMIDGDVQPVNVKVIPQVREPITVLTDGLLAPSGNAYQWIRNDSSLVGATNQKLTTKFPGIYRVKITRGPCVSDTIKYILRPPKPVLKYTEQVCVGKTQTIEATGSQIIWYDKAGQALSIFKNTYTMSSLREVDSLIFATQYINNVQSLKQKAKWLVYPYPSSTLTSVGGVLTASTGKSYQWFANGEPITGATNKTYTVTNEGVYFVQVSNGTCMTKSKEYTYTAAEDEGAVTIGYDREKEMLFINSGRAKPVQIVIYDATGRQLGLSPDQLTHDTHTVSLKGTTSGMYIANVKLDDNRIFRAKFLRD